MADGSSRPVTRRLVDAARLVTRHAIGLLALARRSWVGRLPLAGQLLSWIQNHVVPRVTKLLYRDGPQQINGIVMAVPRPPAWGGGGEFHMVVGSYERTELQFVLRHLRPGECFVDVGAHIGYFSLPAAKRVGPAGRVIAMEPTPESAGQLRENVSFNGFQWVDVIEAAASSSSGQGQFTTSETSAMWNTLEVGTLNGPTTQRVVEMRTIDEVLAAAGWPDVAWIKMDVEGHEQAVLNGCQDVIQRCPNVRFMFEVSGGAPERVDASLRTVNAFEARGFEFFELVSAREAIRIDAQEIELRLHAQRWQDSLFNLIAQGSGRVP